MDLSDFCKVFRQCMSKCFTLSEGVAEYVANAHFDESLQQILVEV